MEANCLHILSFYSPNSNYWDLWKIPTKSNRTYFLWGRPDFQKNIFQKFYGRNKIESISQ
jgi:hypothetical protein